MSRLLAALCALVLLLPTAAGAQERSGQTPPAPVTLDLVDFTGTLVPGGELRLLVEVHNPNAVPVDDLSLLTTLHRATTSRLDYEQAVDDGDVGAVFSAFAEDLEPLPPRGTRVLELARSAADLRFGRPGDKHGVYPMVLQLERESEAVDIVRTSVVLAPAEVDQPLAVSLLVPLDAPPGVLADGTYAGSRVTATLGPGGRIARLVDTLHASPVPVTIAHSGLLLEQALDLADGYTVTENGTIRVLGRDSSGARSAATTLQRVRETASRPTTTQLALSYGPADLVALVRGGMGTEAARLLSKGQAVVEELTGARPADRILWPPDGLDPATLEQAVSTGVEAVVLDEDYLAVARDRDLSFSPSPVRRLRTGSGESITALVPDPFLESALRQTETRAAQRLGSAVAAQRIVAEAAAVYFERPNAAAPRGILIAPPQVWNPPRGLLDELLSRIGAAPWAAAVGLPELAETVDADEDAVRLGYPRAAAQRELPREYIDELASARATLGSLERVLAGDTDTPERLDNLLARAPSVHYRGRLREEGRRLVTTVRATTEEVASAVTVAEGTPVTLTSREGEVPVTFTNAADVPLDVRVRLESTYFEFAQDVVDLTLEGDSTLTRSFRVAAVSPGGTYPVRVVVEDPQGLVVLAAGRLVVRSTAYSVTALLVTGGAALFLLAWWLRDARRRRSATAARATDRAAA